MQQRDAVRPIPLSQPKKKDNSFLPKIQRTDHASNGKSIFKNIAKQYNHKAMFTTKGKKVECDESEEKVIKGMNENPEKLGFRGYKGWQLEEQKIKQSKQYCELSWEIEQMQRQFAQQMQEIEKKKQQIESKCNEIKSGNFKEKYQFWELKNEIMNLENLLRNQEDETYRIINHSYYYPMNMYPQDSEPDLQDEEDEEVRSSLVEGSSEREAISADNESNW